MTNENESEIVIKLPEPEPETIEEPKIIEEIHALSTEKLELMLASMKNEFLEAIADLKLSFESMENSEIAVAEIEAEKIVAVAEIEAAVEIAKIEAIEEHHEEKIENDMIELPIEPIPEAIEPIEPPSRRKFI